MKVLLSEQMKKIEKTAIDSLGIPSLILMENAAVCLCNECIKYLKDKINPCVTIFCGKGNNGGDGLALARLLYVKNINTNIIFVGDNLNATDECKINFNIAKKLNIPIIEIQSDKDNLNKIISLTKHSDLVIDSLIGTGLKKDLNLLYIKLVDIINMHSKYIISADCPTGINSDTGEVKKNAVKANKTVTFYLPKVGNILYPGYEYCNKLIIGDISIPYNLCEQSSIKYNILTDSDIKKLLPERKSNSNKGTYGKSIVFSGSDKMPGACAIVCSAVYKSGGGLVQACTVDKASSIIHNILPEAITNILPAKNGMLCKESFENIKDILNTASVIVLGPGIGVSNDTIDFTELIVKNASVPIIIDADGLNCISENINILKNLKAPCIITPHPREMSRLTGLNIDDILNNAIQVSLEFSEKWNLITLLKGSRTIISNPLGDIYINQTGCNAMSKAGTGDCLCGVIAGLCSQNSDLFNCAVLGAYINGKAGEFASQTLSNYGVLARDIINSIPYILNNYK